MGHPLNIQQSLGVRKELVAVPLTHPEYPVSTIEYYFQGFAIGADGAHGRHVQKHAEQAPGLVQEPNMDQIMVDSSVQDHRPSKRTATQMIVQEITVGGSWKELVVLFEHPCFTLSTPCSNY